MAATRLTDVIVPDIWNPYVIQRTAELSALFQSGIIAPVTELSDFFSEGGNVLNLPFWNDLSGNSEVLSATGSALTVNAIDSGQDKAVVCARGKAWGTNELAAQLSGDDPANAIADLVAGFWARDFQDTLISLLTGVFDALGDESVPVNVHDISDESGSAGIISADAMLDAIQLLGDAKGKLTAISMHSAVENYLAKQDIIDYTEPSETDSRIPYYQDKRVVVDDGHPTNALSPSGTSYDTYIFGAGAIGYAEGTGKLTPVETDRVALQGEDILINRRNFVMHCRGVAWGGTDPTGGGPTNAELATASNWSRVYESKNIRAVLLRHRIA